MQLHMTTDAAANWNVMYWSLIHTNSVTNIECGCSCIVGENENWFVLHYTQQKFDNL